MSKNQLSVLFDIMSVIWMIASPFYRGEKWGKKSERIGRREVAEIELEA